MSLGWKLGDGKKIKIWQQPWLRNLENPCVVTQPTTDTMNMCVLYLIICEHNTCNTSRTEAMFQKRDVKEILSIPLQDTSSDDKVFWRYSLHGMCTVCSTYKLLMEEVIDTLKCSLRLDLIMEN